MGLVNQVHCCRSDGRLPFGKFHEAVEDSGGDRAESNGCVSDHFADVFQLLSLISEDSELQVPLWGPAHLHIQEGEFVFCHDLNPIWQQNSMQVTKQKNDRMFD